MARDLLEVGRPWYVQGEDGGLWPLNKSNIAYAKSLVVKTGPGKLYGFTAYNSGAAQFLLLFDGTEAPGNGATASVVFDLPAAKSTGAFYGDVGRCFNAGCVLVCSTTSPTLTLGAAELFIDAQYI